MQSQALIGIWIGVGQLPVWLKCAYTLYVCALIPVYYVHYGPANFLWFSDLALLITMAALWFENSLLASMMAVAVLIPELAWNIDFFGRLIFGAKLLRMSDYMFEPKGPLYVRALSLFHVVLPVLLVWLIWRLGYDRRAWVAQSLLGCTVRLVTYLVTDPAKNINWVRGPGNKPQERLPALIYLLLVMIIFPVGIYLPTHWVLSNWFAR